MFDSNFSFPIYQSVSIFFLFFPSSLSKRLEYCYENIQDEILIFKRIRITEYINKNFLQIVIFQQRFWLVTVLKYPNLFNRFCSLWLFNLYNTTFLLVKLEFELDWKKQSHDMGTIMETILKHYSLYHEKRSECERVALRFERRTLGIDMYPWWFMRMPQCVWVRSRCYIQIQSLG